jgi:hypothetical protein
LNGQRIKDAARQYVEIEKAEQYYRNKLLKEIKLLDDLYLKSCNKNIYKMIYTPADGDYRDFVEKIAEQLRKIVI